MSPRPRHAVAALLPAAILAAATLPHGHGHGHDPTPDRRRADLAASVAPGHAARPDGRAVATRQDRLARAGGLAARLRTRVVLRDAPSGRGFARLGVRTGYGAPRVLAVGAVRPGWLGVRTLQRRDRLAWIPTADTRLRHVRTQLVADLSQRRLTVRVDGRARFVEPIGVGRDGSPTPLGRYGVTDRLQAGGGSVYGCCVIALTGHQPHLPPGWTGGTRIALHGTLEPGSVGRRVSSGCLRMRDADLRELMVHVPLGATLVVRE